MKCHSCSVCLMFSENNPAVATKPFWAAFVWSLTWAWLFAACLPAWITQCSCFAHSGEPCQPCCCQHCPCHCVHVCCWIHRSCWAHSWGFHLGLLLGLQDQPQLKLQEQGGAEQEGECCWGLMENAGRSLRIEHTLYRWCASKKKCLIWNKSLFA